MIRRRVLPPSDELAGRDLVEHGGHVVIARQRAEDVALELLDQPLKGSVVAAHERDLMAPNFGDRIGQLDRGVGIFDRLARVRRQRIEQRSGPFEPPRRLVSEASGTSLEAHSEREAAHRAFATSMSVAQIRPSLHRYDLAIGNVPYLVIQ